MPELADVKAGDEVIMVTPAPGSSLPCRRKLATVDRTTRTQILIGPLRFHRTDGHLIGSDSWWPDYIVPDTDIELARMEESVAAWEDKDRRERAIMITIHRANLAPLSTADLERIAAIIKAGQGEDDGA